MLNGLIASQLQSYNVGPQLCGSAYYMAIIDTVTQGTPHA